MPRWKKWTEKNMESIMHKVLITGGSGFLAKRVGDYIAEDESFQVLRPSHAQLDITSLDSCRKWFEENKPSDVIHLAAISDITVCEQNEELSKAVNTQGPVNLALCARESGCIGRFLYASSDQVYTANHTKDRLNTELDVLAPENLYGAEKLEAEEKVSNIIPNAIGLRMDWMFDLKPGKMNYIKLLAMSVKSQTPTQHAVNELRAETYCYEIAVNMKKLLMSDAPGGPYNFGSPASGNSFETAQEVYALLGEYMSMPVKNLAIPVTLDDDRSLAMDQAKINAVGIHFRDTVRSAAYCLERESSFLESLEQTETSVFY